MQLTILGSSSAGNSYILHNEQEALLIECGVRFVKIKEAMGFDFSRVVGCLVTHEHGDHCKAIKDVLSAGIEVYSSAGTLKAAGVDSHHRVHALDNLPVQIGGFRIMAFSVKHDCADPVGFLIDHEETGLILFLTDTYFIPYTFPGLNNILVEANYSQEILDARLKSGVTPAFLRDRVLSSHMSLKTCKELLAANDLSNVNNIVLIHLSDSNSDARQFKREVELQTGKTVHIAAPGLTIQNFNKTPF